MTGGNGRRKRGRSGHGKSVSPSFPVAALSILVLALTPQAPRADEGGVSSWVLGLFGSLAAVPVQPGWSFATFGYNTNVSAGANVAAARSIQVGQSEPASSLSASLQADAGFLFVNPAYVSATPVLGGQASVALGPFRPLDR